MSALRILLLVGGIVVVIVAVLGSSRFAVVSRHKRLVAAFGLLLILVGVVGQYGPRIALERAWWSFTGGLVDVGGYRLRIECFGEGTPTVVMDAGMAQDRHTWGEVPKGIAQFTRVCIYDRAGLGESENGPRPRTSKQIVQELGTLLERSNIQGPLVLVGHSFGGANVRLYASEHPDAVRGLVLVDAIQEDQIQKYAELLPFDQREYFLREQLLGVYESVDVLASLEQVRNIQLPPALHLTVIAAGRSDDFDSRSEAQVRNELQQSLTHLVPDGKLVIASKSGHFVQLDEPNLLIQEIQAMVAQVRKDMGGTSTP